MKNLQKMGGIAALYEAAAYLVAFVVFFAVLENPEGLDPVQKIMQLVENQAILYVMNLLIYVIFGLFLVVLVLALYDRLRAGSPALAQIAAAFGLIWAGLVIASGMVSNIGAGVVIQLHGSDPLQAGSVWLAIDSVVEGLGGGNEIVGGLWVLLVSWAALQADRLPRFLNYIGIVVGVAGMLSAVPALGEIGGMIFGLGQIIWFIWLGIALLRSETSKAG
jgi:hypothetical protein